jgi:hypothetical protein
MSCQDLFPMKFSDAFNVTAALLVVAAAANCAPASMATANAVRAKRPKFLFAISIPYWLIKC